jgi:YrbI family 3-deoxy-D-manno-octulosonate 8-phosphate phosphatase
MKPDFSMISMLALDFDGVLTDNLVTVDEDGRESVTCSRADGHGISSLKKAGVHVVVISKEENKVVSARCGKLGIECFQGIEDKLTLLVKIAREKGVEMKSVAFIGNDGNDVGCIREAGIGIAVSDAYPDAVSAADYVTEMPGGKGAVREICDMILSGRKGGGCK